MQEWEKTQENLDKNLKNLKTRINDMISGSSLKEVSEVILEAATSFTVSEHGYVAFIDPENGDSVGIAFSHMTRACEKYEEMGEARFKILKDGSYGGLLGYSLDTGRSLYTKNIASHPIAHGLPPRHEPVNQFLTVAVKHHKEILGQIVLGNPQDDYNDFHVLIVESIADIYATALKSFL